MEPITRKEIRQLAQKRAVGCPCCGSLLGVQVLSDIKGSDLMVVRKVISENRLRLVTVEDAEEDAARGVAAGELVPDTEVLSRFRGDA